MRSRFILGLGLSVTILIGACSSSPEDQGKANSSQTTDSTAVVTGIGSPDANANGVVVANGAVITPQSVDANAAATGTADAMAPNVPDRIANKMDQIKRGGGDVDPAALASQNASPAPDNSTFTSYLSDAGYEIRAFKNHPTLLKVEKRIEPGGTQKVKVFLRNGKVVEIPAQSIGSLATAAAATIASAAGVAPASDKQPPPGSTGAKSPGN